MLNIDDQSNKNIDEDKEDKKENINSNNLFASLNISSVKEEYNELLQQYSNEPILKSLKLNYIYFITQIISVLAITIASETNFIWGIITIIQISFLGYFVHYLSHHVNFLELYDKYNNNNLITKNKYINYLLRLYCKSIDFHDITHHDSDINKTVDNVIIEFIMNFFMQAGWFLIVMFVIKNLNYYVVLLWGIFYPSFHLINYAYIRSQTHVNHHANKMSNYGIDFWDLIFYTKYNDDYEEIENINHYSINLIILTVFIVLFIKKGPSFFKEWF